MPNALAKAGTGGRPARVGIAAEDDLYRQLEIAAHKLGTSKSSLAHDILQSFLAAQEDLPDLPVTAQLFHAAAESKHLAKGKQGTALRNHLTDHLVDVLYAVRRRTA